MMLYAPTSAASLWNRFEDIGFIQGTKSHIHTKLSAIFGLAVGFPNQAKQALAQEIRYVFNPQMKPDSRISRSIAKGVQKKKRKALKVRRKLFIFDQYVKTEDVNKALISTDKQLRKLHLFDNVEVAYETMSELLDAANQIYNLCGDRIVEYTDAIVKAISKPKLEGLAKKASKADRKTGPSDEKIHMKRLLNLRTQLFVKLFDKIPTEDKGHVKLADAIIKTGIFRKLDLMDPNTATLLGKTFNALSEKPESLHPLYQDILHQVAVSNISNNSDFQTELLEIYNFIASKNGHAPVIADAILDSGLLRSLDYHNMETQMLFLKLDHALSEDLEKRHRLYEEAIVHGMAEKAHAKNAEGRFFYNTILENFSQGLKPGQYHVLPNSPGNTVTVIRSKNDLQASEPFAFRMNLETGRIEILRNRSELWVNMDDVVSISPSVYQDFDFDRLENALEVAVATHDNTKNIIQNNRFELSEVVSLRALTKLINGMQDAIKASLESQSNVIDFAHAASALSNPSKSVQRRYRRRYRKALRAA